MSLEYETEILNAMDCRTSIIEALQVNSDYEVLTFSDPTCVLLRLTKNPPREKWPEDVALFFEDAKVRIVFHMANRVDRQALVHLLEEELSRLGRLARFVES